MFRVHGNKFSWTPQLRLGIYSKIYWPCTLSLRVYSLHVKDDDMSDGIIVHGSLYYQEKLKHCNCVFMCVRTCLHASSAISIMLFAIGNWASLSQQAFRVLRLLEQYLSVKYN